MTEQQAERRIGNGLLITGYVFAFLGGLIGVAIGAYVMTAQVKVADKKLKKYDANSRYHGRMMLIIAIALFILFSILNIMTGM